VREGEAAAEFQVIHGATVPPFAPKFFMAAPRRELSRLLVAQPPGPEQAKGGVWSKTAAPWKCSRLTTPTS
jgi:hypothetical protein